MDSKKPDEIVNDLVQLGVHKAHSASSELLLKGFQSGALLGIATVLAYTVAVQSHLYFLGALAFPVGFAIIILIGYELVTSNFAIVPMAWLNKQISFKEILRNWLLVFIGNLFGSLFFATLFFIYHYQPR